MWTSIISPPWHTLIILRRSCAVNGTLKIQELSDIYIEYVYITLWNCNMYVMHYDQCLCCALFAGYSWNMKGNKIWSLVVLWTDSEMFCVLVMDLAVYLLSVISVTSICSTVCLTWHDRGACCLNMTSELRRCMKVEVDFLGFLSLIVRTVSVDVK